MIVTLLKAVHIAALLVWAAGLISLPMMLSYHEDGEHQFRYARLRKFTHHSYTRLVTPAAVTAIAAGVPLIFLRDVFELWLFGKLVLVGLLVILHAYIGHIVLKMGEESEEKPPPAWPFLLGLAILLTAILFTVLSKPALHTGWVPDSLSQPLNRQLPLGEVPN